MAKLLVPVLLALIASGGANVRKAAVSDDVFYDCLDKTIAFAGSTDILPGEPVEISGDNTPDKGSFVKLTTLQQVNGMDVKIEWDYAESKSDVYKKTKWDETHDMLEFNYPEIGGTAKNFNFKVKSMTCNKVKKTHDQLAEIYGKNIDYTVSLLPDSLIYDDLSVATMSALNDQETGYAVLDYSNASNVWFQKPHNQKYYYAALKGQVMYMSPDFNWGIVGDGKSYTEIYFGGSNAERAKDFPLLKPGKFVEIRGDLGHYNGNMQFSYVCRVRELKGGDKAKIKTASKKFPLLTEQDIADLVVNKTTHQYVVPGLMNSLRSVKGSYVAGSLKNSDGAKANSITANKRYTFLMQVGEQQIKIAYDYHAQLVTDETPFESLPLIQELNEIIANPDKTYTLKGTMRYEGKDMNAKVGKGGSGVWTLVPFEMPNYANARVIVPVACAGAAAAAGVAVGLYFFLKKRKVAVVK